MPERPILDRDIDSETFRSFYYLKEELSAFCRANGLPSSGSKANLTERIAHFLDTGEILSAAPKAAPKQARIMITKDTPIEANIICSEKHRGFFKAEIGKSFSFNVPFQKWLKSNAGKTYGDAVEAYYRLKQEKKEHNSEIDAQFEYNTYIRDFFADNAGRSLAEAILCWKYKNSMQGSNRYERSDLSALKEKGR